MCPILSSLSQRCCPIYSVSSLLLLPNCFKLCYHTFLSLLSRFHFFPHQHLVRLPSPLRGGSFSIIRSPSACRATTYDHRGCDSLQSGSRLLNLTGSVCTRVCRAASLRQLLCLLRLLYPSWNQCQQNAANGWFTKLGDYFFDTMLNRMHVLWAEIGWYVSFAFSFLSFFFIFLEILCKIKHVKGTFI